MVAAIEYFEHYNKTHSYIHSDKKSSIVKTDHFVFICIHTSSIFMQILWWNSLAIYSSFYLCISWEHTFFLVASGDGDNRIDHVLARAGF